MDEMNNSQLGFRGIRTSKFRHTYGVSSRREFCYDNIKITNNAHDSNFCAVNPKFVAIVTEVAGGGSFLVLPLEKVGRIEYHNVPKVTGHSAPVLDIKWNPFDDNIIASSSDDATVKLWYIPPGGLDSNLTDCLADLRAHRRRVGLIEWHPTAENILASVGFDYKILIWHASKAEILTVIECHTDIIYSLSFNRDGSLLSTTCKDKKLRIIDPRNGAVVKEGQCHTGTKASKVIFLGNSGRLLTTGFARYSDRQFAIWDQSDLSKPLKIEVIDSSSGVLFPFYDQDTGVLYLAGKGDGNIRFYEIVPHPPWSHYLSHFLSGSPQKGLAWMPKRGCEVFRCEIARFYKLHTTKGLCEPISMIVPRKSDQFQEDIFPDTAAPMPAVTAGEWMSGINRDPVLISLRTGVIVKTHKPALHQSYEMNAGSIDRNTEKKLAFIMQETVPDYRTMDDSTTLTIITPDNDKCEGDYYTQDSLSDLDDNAKSNSLDSNYDDDSGINTDLSLGTVPHESPQPLTSSSRSASSKIIQLIHNLQKEANKYEMAKEKDTKEKWEKTRMNKAVQQNKVANMILQLQNPPSSGSTPNLTTNIQPQKLVDLRIEKDKENGTHELLSFDDYRRAYVKKCFEVERLQLMLAVRDKRILELEEHINLISGGSGRTTTNYIANRYSSDITKTL